MKKLSKINETIWGRSMERAIGGEIRTEDKGLELLIDGQKWNLTKDFMDMAVTFEEENSDEWRCLAFHKPENGSHNVNANDGAKENVVGYNKWDIGEEEFDVYYLREFVGKKPSEIYTKLINNSYDSICVNTVPEKVIDIINDYTHKLVDSHLSEVSKYCVYELWHNLEDGKIFGIKLGCGNKDDVPGFTGDKPSKKKSNKVAAVISYPTFDDWYLDFENDIVREFQSQGWKWIKSYEPDPFAEGSIGNTRWLCFIGESSDEMFEGTIWGRSMERALGKGERQEEASNLTQLKPIDMGTSVLWASEDLHYKGEDLFSYDDINELEGRLKNLGWRVPTNDEFKELVSTEGFEREHEADTYRIVNKFGTLSFPARGCVYDNKKFIDPQVYYGWLSDEFQTGHLIISFDGNELYYSGGDDRRGYEWMKDYHKLCVRLVKDK